MAESDPLIPPPDVEAPGAGVVSKHENYTLGVVFALLAACCSVGMSACSKWAGQAAVTPYTRNFVMSVVGTVIMAVLLLVQKKPFLPNFPGCWSWFFAWGVSLWFFMWGALRALQLVDLASWQAMAACFNNAMILILAAAFLGETIGVFKLGVLARNAVVIALISKPPFIFAGKSAVSLAGLGFILVHCMGASIGSVIQRHLCDQPTESVIFWGFFANIIYWLPPGVYPPQLRAPYLWPVTADDQAQNPEWSLLKLSVIASIFESLWYVFAGYGLKQIDAGSFFLLLVPLTLVLSVFVSIMVFHETIDGLTYSALAIIGLGFAFDHWWQSSSRKTR